MEWLSYATPFVAAAAGWLFKSVADKQGGNFKYWTERLDKTERRLSRLEAALDYALERQPEHVQLRIRADVAAYMAMHEQGEGKKDAN
jgi:hypothetical protein